MTLEKVKNIVAEQLQTPAEKLSAETELKSLGADSLDMTDIIFALEEEFNITVDDNDNIKKIKTIADVVRYIEAKQ